MMKQEAIRRKPREEETSSQLIPNLLKTLLFSILLFFALNLIFSLIAYFQKDPNIWLYPFGLLSAALTAFFGGWFLTRLEKHNALICGLLSAGLFTCFSMILSLFFRNAATPHSLLRVCIFHALFFVISVIGGYAGLPKIKPKRKRKR